MSIVFDQEWEEYKRKFKKQYKDEEDQVRRKLYAETKTKVEEHNKKYESGEVTYSIGINHLADFTAEERSQHCCGGLKK